MNDIDRSVESMDFDMRRRFAFKEIHASDTMEMIKSNDYLKEFYPLIEERMKNLNLCILTIQGFSSAYQIGAAYFLKLANYLEEEKLTEMAWENLWSNHLQGLLFEYLRGLPNADEELQKLYRAFLLEEKYKKERADSKQQYSYARYEQEGYKVIALDLLNNPNLNFILDENYLAYYILRKKMNNESKKISSIKEKLLKKNDLG